MKPMSKLTNLALACGLATMSFNTFAASSEKSNDPYIAGFQTWAKELGADSLSNHAANTYAQDVAATVKKAGYIGDVLPLPKAVQVTDGVYLIVGSQIWHNPANFGLNNNVSFVIFDSGVFVFNAGANPSFSFSFHPLFISFTFLPFNFFSVFYNLFHSFFFSFYLFFVFLNNLYSI